MIRNLYLEYIKKHYNSIIKTNYPIKKWAKYPNRHFSKKVYTNDE